MSEQIEAGYKRWLRTGKVPRRVEFGPAFQDDWNYRPDYKNHDIFGERRPTVKRYGFALPCREAVDALLKLSPIIEVGAGAGTWAAILAANGADIIATDLAFKTDYGFHSGRYHKVHRMSASNAIIKHPDRNVLMIWPCYSAEWPTKAVRLIRPGRSLALISEGSGGCCGADSLFSHLDKYFRHVRTIDIPCWYGIHDRLDIYRRVIGAPPSPADNAF